jgi:hypothetical protein
MAHQSNRHPKHPPENPSVSVFIRQQERRRVAVGFGDDPREPGERTPSK